MGCTGEGGAFVCRFRETAAIHYSVVRVSRTDSGARGHGPVTAAAHLALQLGLLTDALDIVAALRGVQRQTLPPAGAFVTGVAQRCFLA